MTTAPNTGHRWALSPIDSRSHLLAQQDGAPVGMLIAMCGQLLPCSMDTSPCPPTEGRCPSCTRAASQACAQLPIRGADSVTGLSHELVTSLALRRAHDGGVAKVGDRYVDSGSPTPSYLAGAFDELINAGLLALADEDQYGLRRVSVTEAGHARSAQLGDTRQQAGLWVPKPRFPTTRPTGCPPAEHPDTSSGWSA